ncbi:MAG: hypothetical protein ACYTF1_18225 [Planctomycetota bacterium]|jgi:hypothetical protein
MKTIGIIGIAVLLGLNLAAQIEINPQPKEQIVVKSPLIGISAVKPDNRRNVIILFRTRADGNTEALRIDQDQIDDIPWHQWIPLSTKEPALEQPDKTPKRRDRITPY